MELKDIINLNNYVVLGDTLNEEKYAYKIKHELLKHNKNVACVYKELKSINDVDFNIDCIISCINSVKGLELLKDNHKPFKTLLIQPGAQSDNLINYLNENKVDYLEGCILVGLKLYK